MRQVSHEDVLLELCKIDTIIQHHTYKNPVSTLKVANKQYI